MKICELFNLYAGGDLDKENYSKYQTTKYCFPIYSNSLTNKGLYGYTSRPRYKEDSITITGRGTIGVAEFRKDKFDAIIRLLVLEKKTNNLSQYITYYINHFIKFNVESTGVPQLTVPQIKNIEIKLPDLSVQKNVVEYLTNIEKYIKSLEKLIEKKKLIKQGVMQELLTGKKRLPGFNKPWHTECLKKLAKDIKTGTKNNEDKNIYGKYPFFVRSQNIEKIDSYSYEGEAILIPGEGNIGKIFHYINGKFDYHQRVYKLSDFQNISGKFLYFYLLNYFGRYALKNTVKATVDSLRLDTFHKFNVFLPTELKEQEEIANILTNMDEEIESLEQDLEKYKHIKQGMMEQLLTGKIRVV